MFHRSGGIFTQVRAIVRSSPTLHVVAFRWGKWVKREYNLRDATSIGHPPTQMHLGQRGRRETSLRSECITIRSRNLRKSPLQLHSHPPTNPPENFHSTHNTINTLGFLNSTITISRSRSLSLTHTHQGGKKAPFSHLPNDEAMLQIPPMLGPPRTTL